VLDENALRVFIKEGKTVSMDNLNYSEKLALNFIAWGRKKGLKIRELKDWYLAVSQSPFQDDIDKNVLEILEAATKIESES